MKRFKLPLLLLLFLLPLIGVLYYFFIFDNSSPEYHQQWETVYKDDQGKVKSRLSTEKEIKANNLPLPSKKSVAPPPKTLPKWREKLNHELLRFQKPDTVVIIRVGKTIENPSKKRLGRYHRVLVNYRTADGQHSAFSALVSEETGKVVRTWNRTIHEDYSGKNKIRLTPSGTL
jgi:hypothetical protein